MASVFIYEAVIVEKRPVLETLFIPAYISASLM